jgi:hypothetical protein
MAGPCEARPRPGRSLTPPLAATRARAQVSAEDAARQALASSLQRVGRGGLNEQQQDDEEEGGAAAAMLEERGSRSAAVVADAQLVRAPCDAEQVRLGGRSRRAARQLLESARLPQAWGEQHRARKMQGCSRAYQPARPPLGSATPAHSPARPPARPPAMQVLRLLLQQVARHVPPSPRQAALLAAAKAHLERLEAQRRLYIESRWDWAGPPGLQGGQGALDALSASCVPRSERQACSQPAVRSTTRPPQPPTRPPACPPARPLPCLRALSVDQRMLLYAHDELDMAVMRMELRQPGTRQLRQVQGGWRRRPRGWFLRLATAQRQRAAACSPSWQAGAPGQALRFSNLQPCPLARRRARRPPGAG